MPAGRRHIFLALSRPRDGREEEFHRWYDTHHLGDVVDFAPGFVLGRRYYAIPDQPPGIDLRWPSLAVYLLDAADVAALHRGVTANVPRFTPSGGVFEDDHVAWVYSPSDEAVASPDWTPVAHGAEAAPPRWLVLALGQAPIATAAVGRLPGVVRGHRFARHPDQRPGIEAPYSDLTLFELATTDPGRTAAALAAMLAAEVTWVFEPRGTERASRALDPGGSEETAHA